MVHDLAFLYASAIASASCVPNLSTMKETMIPMKNTIMLAMEIGVPVMFD